MTMKWKDIEALFKRLYFKCNPKASEEVFKIVWDEMGMVSMSRTLAQALWIMEVPEDDDTRELRHQMKYLQRKGRWDYHKTTTSD